MKSPRKNTAKKTNNTPAKTRGALQEWQEKKTRPKDKIATAKAEKSRADKIKADKAKQDKLRREKAAQKENTLYDMLSYAFGGRVTDPMADYQGIQYAKMKANPTYIPSPDETLMENQIRQVRAMEKVENNPWHTALDAVGGAALNYGMSMMSSGATGAAGGGGSGLGLGNATGGLNADGTDDAISFWQKTLGGTQSAAYGGTMGMPGGAQDVRANVEGEEVAQFPDGSSGEFEGPDHEQGGIDTMLPKGTTIFSKRIKLGKDTMAQRKKKRDNLDSSISNKTDKNPTDAPLRNAAERAQAVNGAEEGFDLTVQEFIDQMKNAQERESQIAQKAMQKGIEMGGQMAQQAMAPQEDPGMGMPQEGMPPGMPMEDEMMGYEVPEFAYGGTAGGDPLEELFGVFNGLVGKPDPPKKPTKFEFGRDPLVNREDLSNFGKNFQKNIPKDFYNLMEDNQSYYMGYNNYVEGEMGGDSKASSFDFSNKDHINRFLSQYGLEQDGMIGPQFYEALKNNSSRQQAISNKLIRESNVERSIFDMFNPEEAAIAESTGVDEGNTQKTGEGGEEAVGGIFSKIGDYLSGAGSPTFGDVLGMYGNLKQGYDAKAATMANRAGDTPNINPYRDYGKEALKVIDQSKQYARMANEASKKEAQLMANTSAARNRQSATGINTMRAMNLATDAQLNSQRGELDSKFAEQILGIMSQEAGFRNAIDDKFMTGEKTRRDEDLQDRDSFFEALAQNNMDISKGLANAGKTLNDMKARGVNENFLNMTADHVAADIKSGKIELSEGFDGMSSRGDKTELFESLEGWKDLGYEKKDWEKLNKHEQWLKVSEWRKKQEPKPKAKSKKKSKSKRK